MINFAICILPQIKCLNNKTCPDFFKLIQIWYFALLLHWLDVPSYDGNIYDPTQVQGCQKWHG